MAPNTFVEYCTYNAHSLTIYDIHPKMQVDLRTS